MNDAPPPTTSDAEAEALLGRLAGEFTERLAAGDRPGVEEYARRHPELASVLRQVLPALLALGPPPAADDPPPADRPGRLGDFRIVRELGRGGMGVVYEAEQVSLSRRVALKVLPLAATLDARQLQRFKTEAQAAAHLHHQNIVPVYAVGCERGVHFYAMQFIEGRTLAALVQDLRAGPGPARRPVGAAPGPDTTPGEPPGAAAEDPDRTGAYDGPADAPAARDPRPVAARSTARPGRPADRFRTMAGLAVQAAEALEHAHQFGVVHRDVKPANLMVDARGNLWVADFGLARLQGGSGHTATGDVVGTLRYMSPEQAAGRRDVDHRTDVYSLGATLYELLTLCPAVDGASQQEMLRKVASDEPRRPRRHDPAIPADLETVVLKAMAKVPGERYQTAKEVADDLRRFLEDRPIHAKRPTLVQRTRKWARRHRAVVTTAAAGAVLLLMTAVVALAVSNVLLKDEEGRTKSALGAAEAREKEAEASRREAEASLVDMTASSGSTAGDRNDPAAAALWFAHAARLARNDPDRERANLIRSRNWARVAPAPVAAVHHPGEKVVKVAFHPAGRSLMVLTEKRCAVVGLPDGRPEPLPGGDRPVSAADWSPDGARLALATPGGTVEIIRTADGQRLQAFEHPGSVDIVRFSPDGHYLAVAGAKTRAWDCQASGFATPELPHPRRVFRLVFNGRGDRLATTAVDGWTRVFAVPGGPQPVTAPLPNRLPGPPGNLPYDPVFVDGDRGLLTTDDQGVVVWRDTTTWKEVRRISHQSGTGLVTRGPDGRRLFVGTQLSGEFWDIDPARAVGGSSIGHSNVIYAAAFSPDGQALLTVGADRTARLWSVPGGAAQYSTLQHQNDVKFAAFSPDGRLFATGQEDGLVRVWAVPKGFTRPRQMRIAGEDVLARLSPDGRHAILDGGLWGALWATRVYDVPSGEPAGPYLAANGVVMAAALSPDGTTAATAAATEVGVGGKGFAARAPSGRLQFWDWRTGRPLAGPVPLPSAPRDVAFSPDGRVAVVACHAGQVVTADPATGRVLARPDTGPVVDPGYRSPEVRFTPDGRCFLTSGTNTAVRVWRTSTGEPHGPPLDHGAHVLSARPSADGRLAVTGAWDNAARVWDLDTGRQLAEPLRHPDYVFDAGFSPDGSLVVTACRDGSARVWDWRAGPLVCPPLKHSFEAWGATFTPDGRWVVVTSRNGLMRVWDPRTGKAVTPPYQVGNGLDRPALVTPDGRYVVTSGSVWSATIFDLDELTRPGDLGPDDAVTLGELLSGHSVFAGEPAGLTTEEWLDRWRSWAAAHPGHDATAPLAARDWHRGKANGYEVGKQWAGAAWHLERLTALEPGKADLWVRLGEARQKAGRHAEAVAAFDEAIRLNPDDAHSYSARAAAHGALKANEAAVTDLTEAIRLTPWDWRLYNGRSLFRRLLGDHDGAVADATEAIRLVPKHPNPGVNRGDSYRARGDYDRAIADYTEAIRCDPGYAYAYKARGHLYATFRKDPARAIADFTEAIRLDPKDPLTYSNRADCYAEKKDDDRAIADLGKALELNLPNRASLYSRRGRSYLRKKEYEKAIADLTEAIRLDPKNGIHYATRGTAYAEKKDYDRAIEDFTAAIRLDPKAARPYYNRGNAYRHKGEVDEAIADFTEAIRLDPKSAAAFNDRALAFAAKREYAKTIADCDAAIRLNPQLSAPWHNRGSWRLAAGDVDGALADLTEAIRLDPSYPRSHLRRGHAWATKGDWDRANCDLAHAAALEPDDHQAMAGRCVLALRLGSAADYNRCCARLFDQFAGTKDPLIANDVAWACAVSPESGIDPRRLVELAERGLAKDRKDPNALNTRGAALYRAGRYDEAAARLDEAVRFRDGKGLWADWLFLAMAHHHLGHRDEARRWLAKATDWWDKAGPDGPKDERGLPLPWSDRVVFRVLRAEAEALLEPGKP